jgi:hypothetical protein
VTFARVFDFRRLRQLLLLPKRKRAAAGFNQPYGEHVQYTLAVHRMTTENAIIASILNNVDIDICKEKSFASHKNNCFQVAPSLFVLKMRSR